jgi:myo-inositol 2-dehydrogenase/D-chiro-inositol 1-dehydrogenase
MEPISFGVIGAGRIGRLHAANIANRVEGAQLRGVADINASAAAELARKHSAPIATKDYHELLHDPVVRAVVIGSSTETHAQIVQEAAAAGKHIFCEKPIDLDLNRIARALQAVQAAGVKLQVGFNRRFDPSFAKVRELVAAGRIGVPQILRITSRDPAPPPIEYLRGSGGIFLDMTIHDFDMTRFVSGSEAVEIYAVGGAMNDPALDQFGDVDTCIITMKLKNGMLATIDNSRQAVYGYDQRLEVFGSGGMATAANRTPDMHLHFDAEGVHSAKPEYFFLERYKEAFVAEVQEFVNCIRKDTEPPVSGMDGLMPVVMGLAARKALAEARPVKVEEIYPRT